MGPLIHPSKSQHHYTHTNPEPQPRTAQKGDSYEAWKWHPNRWSWIYPFQILSLWKHAVGKVDDMRGPSGCPLFFLKRGSEPIPHRIKYETTDAPPHLLFPPAYHTGAAVDRPSSSSICWNPWHRRQPLGEAVEAFLRVSTGSSCAGTPSTSPSSSPAPLSESGYHLSLSLRSISMPLFLLKHVLCLWSWFPWTKKNEKCLAFWMDFWHFRSDSFWGLYEYFPLWSNPFYLVFFFFVKKSVCCNFALYRLWKEWVGKMVGDREISSCCVFLC